MIPTPREVTELEEKIDDLEHDNSNLNSEIADLLFERDTLNDRINRLDAQIRDWEGIAQTQSESISYLRDQSETWRVAAVNWEQLAKDRADSLTHWATMNGERFKNVSLLREFFQIREDFSDAAAVQEIMNQHCELRSLYETQSEELGQWADSSQDDNEAFYLEVGRGDAAEERASAWWEIAKQLVRVRDVWVGTADMWQSVAASRNSELAELKKALRVLGDGER